MLQTSTDLANWQPAVNLLTTNSTVAFVDNTASNAPVRFYRVRSPGLTATQAVATWQTCRPAHYQYSFQTTKSQPGYVIFEGTVTVLDGIKTVTNVTANGVPTATFDPADFLTPDEIFTEIAGVESQGAKLAQVTYDEQWGFAETVNVIPSTGVPMKNYQISDFLGL